MSELIKHECGVAMVRLLKPLDYYLEKYGTALYGLNKLALLMEKQHNRGHDGAGIACLKIDVKPGKPYIFVERSNGSEPIGDIFNITDSETKKALKKQRKKRRGTHWLKDHLRFCGELYLGHLRYGTFGKNTLECCHPLVRENNWISRNLVLAGNFNLTNVDDLFQILVDIGQHPKEKSDTVTVLEKIGHFLDKENERLYGEYRGGKNSNREIASLIASNLDIGKILVDACKKWDGGYVIAGLIGHGDAFVLRDPNGIRPAYHYRDEEVMVVASERPVIQTAFNAPLKEVREVPPGKALIIRKDGNVTEEAFTPARPRKACSFERIYFSRGSDADIYQERKELGRLLTPRVLDSVDHDLRNTVFSFIPNTAETCFFGMIEALEDYCDGVKRKKLLKWGNKPEPDKLDDILGISPRIDKIAVKDAKMRTFITADVGRNDLVAHVYDITYGTVVPGVDNLVVIDDSIVRGTTLKRSILRILDRLEPKLIVVVSSAPQIRYPDCYGIDMAKLGDFVAFRAAVELLKETGQSYVLDMIYQKAKAQDKLPKEKIVNHIKGIYEPFTEEEIAAKIAELLTPVEVKAEVKILYQTVENLHKACPNHLGDWYFTGDYPTPGGNKVVNKSFLNFMEGKNKRAY